MFNIGDPTPEKYIRQWRTVDARQLDYWTKPDIIRKLVYLNPHYETEVLEHLRSNHEERGGSG
jgi:hypothetical protein